MLQQAITILVLFIILESLVREQGLIRVGIIYPVLQCFQATCPWFDVVIGSIEKSAVITRSLKN